MYFFLCFVSWFDHDPQFYSFSIHKHGRMSNFVILKSARILGTPWESIVSISQFFVKLILWRKEVFGCIRTLISHMYFEYQSFKVQVLEYYSNEGIVDVAPITLPGWQPNLPFLQVEYLESRYKQIFRVVKYFVTYSDKSKIYQSFPFCFFL